jgi:glycosyltransferase involved in cell wall biosynthesis
MIKILEQSKITSKAVSWTRGVDRKNLKPSKIWKHNKVKPTVLYVGRVSKEKNLEDLCRLQDRYSIEIVGSGPHLEYLCKKYERVKFLGYQQGSKLADSYARADVFAFPSKSDTFGIVMIESMSLGTPVAAYPVTGPIDVIEQNVTGIMDEDLSKAIDACAGLDRQQVKKNSERWSWENCWNIFKENLVDSKKG